MSTASSVLFHALHHNTVGRTMRVCSLSSLVHVYSSVHAQYSAFGYDQLSAMHMFHLYHT
jgi:hypothetical protein